MTEDEAKAKWCPQVHLRSLFDATARIDQAEPAAKCIGSACMAWRWLPIDVNAPRSGYCGLVGKPTP